MSFLKIAFRCSFLLLCARVVNPARILAIVPTPSYSHQAFFRPFWIELAKRGHEILLITTDPINDASVANLREIDLGESYDIWNANVDRMVKTHDDKWGYASLVMDTMYNITRLQLSNPEVQRLYRSTTESFDLMIMEYALPAFHVFKRKFDVPMIAVASTEPPPPAHVAVGNPLHSVLYPNHMLGFARELWFVERLTAVAYEVLSSVYRTYHMMPTLNQIIKETIKGAAPRLESVEDDIDMLFVNVNPLFGFVRPFSPATISIAGGFHEVPVKPLPKDIDAFVDNATEGVVYFSLGSNVKSSEISRKTRSVIMRTFAELPYKVLWKFEGDALPGKPDNVMIKKWFPQQDVLRHKHTLAFITQCGLQSLEETLYAGVPVVAMPYYADQLSNGLRLASRGLGVYVNHKKLTVEKFKAAIVDVVTNDKYRRKVNELADLVRDQPMRPLEKALWWTEYVIRHKGAKHLHGPTVPDYQYYYLDIMVFLGSALFVIFATAHFICKKIAAFICLIVTSIMNIDLFGNAQRKYKDN